MKNNKFLVALLLIAFALMAVLPSAFAGDPARTGTAGGSQLLVPVGARDLAMGGANLAFTNGLDAMYWNPAGFANLDKSAMGTFSTMQIFNDIRVNYVSLGVQAGKLGNLGFSIKSIDAGDIPQTTLEDPDGAAGRTFSPTLVTVGLTFSKKLTDVIFVGFTGKSVLEEVPRASASAFAFDAGLQYHNMGGIEGLSIGLAVKNIGSNLQYNGSAFLNLAQFEGQDRSDFQAPDIQQDQLPATVELAVGYRYNINEESNFVLSGNFQNQNFGNDNYKFGGEYNYGGFFSLRGGYLLANDLDSEDQLYRYTFGAGLNFNVSNTDLVLDYAFRDSQYFDSNHLFSLTIGF